MAEVIGFAATPTLQTSANSTNTSLQLLLGRAKLGPLQFQIHSRKWPLHFNINKSWNSKKSHCWANAIPKVAASASASAGSVLEPTTNVKFQTTVQVPGCSNTLTLLGTGSREKVFAIIGVKVYAVGLYLNINNIKGELNAWEGKSADHIQNDSSLFTTLFHASLEKSLQIVLVRDVDGKTFWDALDEAISPRITTPTSIDEAALSTFRKTFQGRPLKKGTRIFLTWAQPSKMLISISMDESPSSVDASIESMNVTCSLFDVFFGDNPVSPTLKASVASGLAAVLYSNMPV